MDQMVLSKSGNQLLIKKTMDKWRIRKEGAKMVRDLRLSQ